MATQTKKFSRSPAQNNKISQPARKELQLQFEATQKYEKFKRTASLPNYYLTKARLKRIAQVYRTLSCDKLTVQTANSSKRSPSQTPEKHSVRHAPFTPANLNSNEKSNPKGRLVIQRGGENAQTQPSTNYLWTQINQKLRNTAHRLQELLQIKQEDFFLNELGKFLDVLQPRKGNSDFSGHEEFGKCLKVLEECLSRREKAKVADVKKSFKNVSEELSNMQIELKKKTIRAILDQKEVEKYQKSSKEFQLQLAELKKKLAKETREIGCNTNTETSQIFANTQLTPSQEMIYVRKTCGCEDQEAIKEKLSECAKQLQRYNKQQKDFLTVLSVLRAEGVDIQRIYDDVVNGRVEANEQAEQSVFDQVQKIQKSQRKLYSKYRGMNAENSFDADNSIVSSADGLSFNYDQKSLEDNVYTVRREYKSKPLQAQLQERLRLNFNVLYQDDIYADQYESEESNPPTV